MMSLLKMTSVLASVMVLNACGSSGVSELTLYRKSKDKIVLPKDYESLSASEKQDLLFQAMEESSYQKLPPLVSVNPVKFVLSRLLFKMEGVTDEAPQGYEKSLHAHGVAAKVRFEAEPGQPYTGLFQGVDHGIIRLSFTSDPRKSFVAPGIALKFLIDGQPSQNVSALYKLSGQGQNHNFFANELSNIIPTEFGPQSLFSQSIFLRVSRHPTKIRVEPFAGIDQFGNPVAAPVAPVQLYFVPNHALDAKSEAHDFREDLLNIPEKSVLYDVYATSEQGTDIKEADKERRAKAVKVGRLVSTSPMIASDFGDRRIFFKHHRFEGNRK